MICQGCGAKHNAKPKRIIYGQEVQSISDKDISETESQGNI